MPDLSKVTAILPNLADYVVYGAIAVVTLIGFFKCLIPRIPFLKISQFLLYHIIEKNASAARKLYAGTKSGPIPNRTLPG